MANISKQAKMKALELAGLSPQADTDWQRTFPFAFARFIQQVSDTILDHYQGEVTGPLKALVLPAPVDPLKEALDATHAALSGHTDNYANRTKFAESLRIELSKHGLKIVEAN